MSLAKITTPRFSIRTSFFLKAAPWKSSKHKLGDAGFRFVFPLPNQARFTLSLDSGEANIGPAKGPRKKVVIANGNFHRTCAGYPSDEQVAEHLTNLESDWSTYQTVLKTALGADE